MKSLMEGVEGGQDPFLVWADFMRKGSQDMARILQCSDALYQRHTDAVTNLGQRQVVSPLTAQHVLNFCEFAKIHPAHLVSFDQKPEFACAPHVFHAIWLVANESTHQKDRQDAIAALYDEEERWKSFIGSALQEQDIFAEVRNYIKRRPDDGAIQVKMRDALRAVERPGLAHLLAQKFKGAASQISLSHPSYHFDDYQIFRHERLSFEEKRIKESQRQNRYLKRDAKDYAANLFGSRHKGQVIERIMATNIYLHEQTDLSPEAGNDFIVATLKAEFHPSGRYQPEEQSRHIRRLVDNMRVYINMLDDIKDKKTKLYEAQLRTFAQDNWMESLYAPERIHILYLYINHEMAKTLSLRPAAVAAMQKYRNDPV